MITVELTREEANVILACLDSTLHIRWTDNANVAHAKITLALREDQRKGKDE